MQNLFLASPLLSDAAVMSDPTSAPTNPDNLQTQQLGEVWGGGTSPAVLVDLLAVKTPVLIALPSHNGSDVGTWRIRAADTAGGTVSAPAYDETLDLFPSGKPTEPWDGLPSMLFDATGLFGNRYVRIDIDDPGAPEGDFFAGRLYICDAAHCWQPAVNMEFGSTFGFDDPTTMSRSVGGHIWPGDQRGISRIFTFKLGFSSENDMLRNAFEIMRLRGLGGDILCSLEPDATEHLHRKTLYGKFTQLQAIVDREFDIWECPFQVQELIP